MSHIIADSRLGAEAASHPFPLVFVTVSGAHLYGFDSPDSDVDLRGAHILPLADVIGLDPGRETVDLSHMRDGLEIDLVTHDLKKFIILLLKKNGYVLEQLLSPLVVTTSQLHEELIALAPQTVTRYHAHHYMGFAQTTWKLYEKEEARRIKPLLYVFRVLLTGAHLMRTGEVEANLATLNAAAKRSFIDDLIAEKRAGAEKAPLATDRAEFYEGEYRRLMGDLEAAFAASSLPERSTARAALNDVLVRARTAGNS